MSKKIYLTQEQIEAIELILNNGGSNRSAAEEVLGSSTKESTIRYNIKNGNILKTKKGQKDLKILVFDCEVSASIVAAFSMFKHFSSPDHVIQRPYMLTWAAAWMNDPNNVFGAKLTDYEEHFDNDRTDDYFLVEALWKVLDECNIAIAHNSKFDQGWFAQRCAFHGFPEPSPYKLICTAKGLKKAFSLPSNSLDYATRYFEVDYKKRKHDGIDLWIRCMQGDKEAFDLMYEYNEGDIPTCMELYKKIRAWIPSHPNVSLYKDSDKPSCRVCGSEDLEDLTERAYTDVSVFEAVRCKNCGKVQRKGSNLNTVEDRKNYFRNVTK